uniref:B3 domain-containing protein REM20 n=1 Tax=Noccaea caerulescens TaxID=107243 RepID=A0A1J3IBX2_NOCCA
MASILSNKQKKKANYTLKELKSLGCDLLSSRAHINNLPLLLSFISPECPPQYVVESLLSLQSFFTPLLSQFPSTSSHPTSTKRPRSDDDEDDSAKTAVADDPEVIFKAWLRSKFDEFVKLLLDVLVSEQSEDTLRDIVLGTLMEFVKLLNVGRFHSSIYHRLLHAIIHSAVDIEIFLDILTSKYFKYIDVRYFTYISMETFVKTLEASVVSGDKTVGEINEAEADLKESLQLSVRKIYQVLSRIPPPDKQAEKSQHEMWSGSDGSSSEKPTDKKKKKKEEDSSVSLLLQIWYSYGDDRVCFKAWDRICRRNNLKNQDTIRYELLHTNKLVHSVRIHITRGG